MASVAQSESLISGKYRMNPTDPLAQLRDIHLPEAVSWWPLAIGWWLVAIVCILGLFFTLKLLLDAFFNQRYRRQALTKLALIADANQQQRLIRVFHLLKQVASSAYPQQNFASLSNSDFIEFLQNSCPKTVFNTLPADCERLFYAKQSSVTSEIVDDVIQQSRRWIKSHPRAKKLRYGS